jgi:DNA-directed RNA polymerase sigma subunit (sigma70/sigma32)
MAASAGRGSAYESDSSSGSFPSATLQALIRRYSIGGDGARRRREIGARPGIEEERSRQLEREALHWLRELPRAREPESRGMH